MELQKVGDLPYERVNADYVIKEIQTCTAEVAKAKSGCELAELRQKCLKPLLHFSSMASLSFARFTLNTRDGFYTAEKDYYDETGPKIDAEYVKFQREFLKNPHVKEAEKYLNPLVIRHYELSVKCTSDKAVPYKIEENKIITEYTKLMAETLFEYNGEKLPLSALKKYFTDKDRAVRKSAYDALGNTLGTIGDKLDDIYDRLVKVRTQTARVLGYNDYSELGDNLMGRISYNRSDIKAFRENVLRDIVPAVTKLKEAVAKRLNISDFMLYDNDTYFTCGNPAPVIDAEHMFKAARDMYRSMSDETGEFFDYMVATDAFDVFPREGKWGGGYCTSFSDYRQPFILANFNGTSADVDVLTHEAGHAFAEYEIYKQNHDLELNVGGMETAETHSMSMEFFCHKYIDKFFGERARDYKYSHIADALSFIPYGTIVDYFQELVYKNPDMTKAERNELWNKLESEFRPWLSVKGIPYIENGTRWQYQMHIYESPMYYIDYCLAQSVALQFLFASRENFDKAFNAYTNLLKQGGEKEFPALVTEAGLNSPFKQGALKKISEKAQKLLSEI